MEKKIQSICKEIDVSKNLKKEINKNIENCKNISIGARELIMKIYFINFIFGMILIKNLKNVD